MNILSLFDGISCARAALDRANIKVDEYYASEIDKYAIQIAQKNYPDTIQMGDIKNINTNILPKIDLLIGGSPCQDLSISKKNREGLNGKRSGLFWEYVRILNELKPQYFILENVNSMPKKDKDIISKTLGIQPVMINAALVSAQQRKRLFWVGKLQGDKYIQVNILQPKDRYILLKDILEENIDKKYYMNKTQIEGVERSNYNDRKPMKLNKKSNCLKIGGDVKRIIDYNTNWRYLTPVEYERLQGLEDNYTKDLSKTQRYKCLGNAFNVDVVVHIIKILFKED